MANFSTWGVPPSTHTRREAITIGHRLIFVPLPASFSRLRSAFAHPRTPRTFSSRARIQNCFHHSGAGSFLESVMAGLVRRVTVGTSAHGAPVRCTQRIPFGTGRRSFHGQTLRATPRRASNSRAPVIHRENPIAAGQRPARTEPSFELLKISTTYPSAFIIANWFGTVF
jgi:hypothetical protein